MGDAEKKNLLEDVLHNELWKNPTINNIINSTIVEYDIRAAHLMAIRILYGDKLYEKLASMNKLARNIEIGNMQAKDHSLTKKLQDLLYRFKLQFVKENNILINNIIETTKDSLVLCQKIPTKTIIIVDNVEVEFRNKEGTYSSFYRLDNKSVLYDSLTGNLRIKGISEETVNNSDFVNKYLKNLLNTIETNISVGSIYCMSLMQEMRRKYINSDDISIYKSLNHKNKYLYQIGGEMIETDVPIKREGANIIKILNYKNFVMPLMKTII